MAFKPPSMTEFEIINGQVDVGDGFTFILDGGDIDWSSVDSPTPIYTIGPEFEATIKIGPIVGPNATNTTTFFYFWHPATGIPGGFNEYWEYFEFQINAYNPGGPLDLVAAWQPRPPTSPAFYSEEARVLYDPVAHQWLRFTISGETLTWKTSPNGTSWSVFASIPFPASWTPGAPLGIEMDFGAVDTDEPYDGMTHSWTYFSINDTGTERLIFGEEPEVVVPEPLDPTRFKSAGACVEVTGEGHVLDIAVGLWVKHPKTEDLEIWLRGPAPYNKRALLVDHNGRGVDLGAGYEDHQIIIFEDDGVNGAVADWTTDYSRVGNFIPITSLTDTYVGTGIDDYANGWWCIDVVDTAGGTMPEIWEYCLYIVSDRIPLSPLGQLWPRGGGDRMVDEFNTKFRERQLLVGRGRPFHDVGGEGDCYLDERTTILYGPKGEQGWDYENYTVLGRFENTVVVYEQPNRPPNARLGTIWLDTDG